MDILMKPLLRFMPVFLRDLVIQTLKHQITSVSAELAYFFLLSVFPLLISLVTLIGYFPIQIEAIVVSLEPYMPSDAYLLVHGLVDEIVLAQKGGLLSFGLIAGLWLSSKAIHSMIRAFNRSYEVEEERSYIKERILSIVLTLSMLLVTLVSFLFPVFGRHIGIFVFKPMGYTSEFLEVWDKLRWTTTGIIFFLVFSMLYYFGPNIKLKCKEVIAGSIFATFGWLLTSYFFSLYVNEFSNYSKTYGSLGGIIMLLLWFYLTAFLILVGGEINALICNKHGEGFQELPRTLQNIFTSREQQEKRRNKKPQF